MRILYVSLGLLIIGLLIAVLIMLSQPRPEMQTVTNKGPTPITITIELAPHESCKLQAGTKHKVVIGSN